LQEIIMATLKSVEKQAKGSVAVESFRDRLRLRLPRQLFGGKQKYLSVGLPDTVLNRRVAESKAKLIESDIAMERFDPTLRRYQAESYQSKPEIDEDESISDLSIPALWQQYFEHKRSTLKPKTIEKYDNFSRLFEKLDDWPLGNAIAVKRNLEQITTISRTKDGLMYLSAACQWGMKHNLVSANPFEGMSGEMPKHQYMVDPQPNAFTEAEREQIIQKFQNDQRRGMSYRPYAGFVEFLFLIGCRPSEAIGLRWKHVSEDCSSVAFEGSIVQVKNKRVASKGSKNNRTRTIAVSLRLQKLLERIRSAQVNPEDLVFPSPDDPAVPINYRNFSRRAWQAIVDPIKPDTTPYCCRDTFITIQLLKGVSSAVIAQWCDTSTHMIDRNYADKLKLTQLQSED
jgi:integrase